MTRSVQAAAAEQDDEQAEVLRDRIVRAHAGDREALGELFVEYGDMVHRTAYRLAGCAADAADITQDVFLRLARALGGFTGTCEQFEGWLRRVVVRQALTHLRSDRRRREVTVEGIANLFSASDDVVNRLTIDAAVARLSDEHRLVFLLKEVEGYDHREIAELLEISITNSEVRLHRARRELRELLRGSR